MKKGKSRQKEVKQIIESIKSRNMINTKSRTSVLEIEALLLSGLSKEVA